MRSPPTPIATPSTRPEPYPNWALLAKVDEGDIPALQAAGARAREIVYAATDSEPLRRQILDAYHRLLDQCGGGISVAVRSSATAEDLPNASFAGQHDSFLHVRGDEDLIEASRRCFASIFTDRAIVYRTDKGFDHFAVALSVAVMRMIDADQATSGVVFTLDTETGFRDVAYVTAVYGLGESLVQGRVDPDEFYVDKPTFRQGFRRVLSRRRGDKHMRLVWRQGGRSRVLTTRRNTRVERSSFCLSDADVLQLVEVALGIISWRLMPRFWIGLSRRTVPATFLRPFGPRCRGASVRSGRLASPRHCCISRLRTH